MLFIETSVDRKAAIVMEDKTNVSIGPSSTLKLDRFVYAGPNKSGTIILNLGKGTCRLVTGDVAKRSYTILTPTAAIGIRRVMLDRPEHASETAGAAFGHELNQVARI
jgi:hypothetical protein